MLWVQVALLAVALAPVSHTHPHDDRDEDFDPFTQFSVDNQANLHYFFLPLFSHYPFGGEQVPEPIMETSGVDVMEMDGVPVQMVRVADQNLVGADVEPGTANFAGGRQPQFGGVAPQNVGVQRGGAAPDGGQRVGGIPMGGQAQVGMAGGMVATGQGQFGEQFVSDRQSNGASSNMNDQFVSSNGGNFMGTPRSVDQQQQNGMTRQMIGQPRASTKANGQMAGQNGQMMTSQMNGGMMGSSSGQPAAPGNGFGSNGQVSTISNGRVSGQKPSNGNQNLPARNQGQTYPGYSGQVNGQQAQNQNTGNVQGGQGTDRTSERSSTSSTGQGNGRVSAGSTNQNVPARNQGQTYPGYNGQVNGQQAQNQNTGNVQRGQGTDRTSERTSVSSAGQGNGRVSASSSNQKMVRGIGTNQKMDNTATGNNKVSSRFHGGCSYHGQFMRDPSDRHSYFRCLRAVSQKYGTLSMQLVRFDCPFGTLVPKVYVHDDDEAPCSEIYYGPYKHD